QSTEAAALAWSSFRKELHTANVYGIATLSLALAAVWTHPAVELPLLLLVVPIAMTLTYGQRLLEEAGLIEPHPAVRGGEGAQPGSVPYDPGRRVCLAVVHRLRREGGNAALLCGGPPAGMALARRGAATAPRHRAAAHARSRGGVHELRGAARHGRPAPPLHRRTVRGTRGRAAVRRGTHRERGAP